jgi:ParB-like chromosome segregation protein Spo0J
VAHVNALALSIISEGVREPLTVFAEEGKYYIENGHCRHAAALLAIEQGADAEMTVPVIVSGRNLTDNDRLLSQITLNSGKSLSTIELAGVINRLSKAGWDNAQIAKRCGFSTVYVRSLISLAVAPAPIIKMMSEGKVAPTLIIDLIKKHDGDYKAVNVDLKQAKDAAKASGKDKITKKMIAPKPKPEPKEKTKSLKDWISQLFSTSGEQINVNVNQEAYSHLIEILNRVDWDTSGINKNEDIL